MYVQLISLSYVTPNPLCTLWCVWNLDPEVKASVPLKIFIHTSGNLSDHCLRGRLSRDNYTIKKKESHIFPVKYLTCKV